MSFIIFLCISTKSRRNRKVKRSAGVVNAEVICQNVSFHVPGTFVILARPWKDTAGTGFIGLMMLKSTEMAIPFDISLTEKIFRKYLKIQKVWIFGSVARNKQNKDSDIDFLVKFGYTYTDKDVNLLNEMKQGKLNREIPYNLFSYDLAFCFYSLNRLKVELSLLLNKPCDCLLSNLPVTRPWMHIDSKILIYTPEMTSNKAV